MARRQRCSTSGVRNEPDSTNANQRRNQHANGRINDHQNDTQDTILERKRIRGFTYMPKIWVVNPNESGREKLEVQFNKLGKPIGPNKSKFVEFLGTIARNGKLAPLNVRNWHDIPQSKKIFMLEIVKGKFICRPGFEVSTLRTLGKSWRSFKNRIKKKHFDKNASMEQNLRGRPTSPDERVLPEHWKYLVSYWSNESTKAISEKNSANRLKKKMQHITGKRSFAQIVDMEKKKRTMGNETEDSEMDDDTDAEDEIEEISRADLFQKCYAKDGNTSNSDVASALQNMKILQSQLPSGAQDKGPNDIFAQVTGPDKGGRVRMYGYGTAAADVHGDIPSRASSYRMNMEYKAALETMQQRLDAQDKRIQDLLSGNKETARNDHPTIRRVSSPSVSRVYAPPHCPQTSNNNSFPIEVGATVYLKSMLDSSIIVAKGFIVSLDPTSFVGHEELGQNWCEVKVNVALEFEESLIRSIENAKTIGEAIGSSIAWPKSLIVVDDPW